LVHFYKQRKHAASLYRQRPKSDVVRLTPTVQGKCKNAFGQTLCIAKLGTQKCTPSLLDAIPAVGDGGAGSEESSNVDGVLGVLLDDP
jgi:hypothetical protein